MLVMGIKNYIDDGETELTNESTWQQVAGIQPEVYHRQHGRPGPGSSI
jgi:hypothetical protein